MRFWQLWRHVVVSHTCMRTDIRWILFDLDDTLYPPGAGLMDEISARITQYIAAHLGMTRDTAEDLRRDYYRRYGSSVRGLVLHHPIDLADFLAFVHDVEVEKYLAPDADLDCLLACIHLDKALFTNAPAAFARRVLRALGIERHFECVFDLAFGGYRGKPDPQVYVDVRRALGVSDHALLIVDDALMNLQPARRLGWTTVWVHGNRRTGDGIADYVVGDLWEIARVFRQVGVLDESHQAIAEHRLAGCAWARLKNDRGGETIHAA